MVIAQDFSMDVQVRPRPYAITHVRSIESTAPTIKCSTDRRDKSRAPLFRECGSRTISETCPPSDRLRALRETPTKMCRQEHRPLRCSASRDQRPSKQKTPRTVTGRGVSYILMLHEKPNWCRLQDSNPPPSDYKSTALPDELSRRSQRFYFI